MKRDDRARVFQVARIVGLQMQIERRAALPAAQNQNHPLVRGPAASFGANHRSRRLDRCVVLQRARRVEEAVAQDRVAPMRLLGEQLAAGVGGQALERVRTSSRVNSAEFLSEYRVQGSPLPQPP